jgi:hypothetical protein
MAAGAKRGPLVKLGDSQFGRVLFSGAATARSTSSRATRATKRAATARAPKGRPRAGRGVDPHRLGTIKRRGGRRQVTYKDQALYS